jgi:predicted alpha/beta-hydrolase family hydrolase
MRHAFMEATAQGLAERGIATLRYQFPYMERGSRRPDAPPLAQATVRAAVAVAVQQAPSLPLFAGGKSFGGRMTSQAQAAAPMRGVRGLVFLGFPLHPAGEPSIDRATHLADVQVPMLFLQGTRDELADCPFCNRWWHGWAGTRTLHALADADHSFHVPAKSGRKDSQVLAEALDAFTAWIAQRAQVVQAGTGMMQLPGESPPPPAQPVQGPSVRARPFGQALAVAVLRIDRDAAVGGFGGQLHVAEPVVLVRQLVPAHVVAGVQRARLLPRRRWASLLRSCTMRSHASQSYASAFCGSIAIARRYWASAACSNSRIW